MISAALSTALASHGPIEAVVIGASAGAVEALTVVLPPLAIELAVPILVVVHIPPDRESILPELFQKKCRLIVREAEDKEPLRKGTIYFAPPDYHLLVERDRTLSLSNEEPVLYSRPSIDVLFETAADAFGESLLGIVLTGANNDGARGLRAVMDANGVGWVQHPELAYASSMPRAAMDACPEAIRMSLEEIAGCLNKLTT